LKVQGDEEEDGLGVGGVETVVEPLGDRELLGEVPRDILGVGVDVDDGEAPTTVSVSVLLVTAEPGESDSVATMLPTADCAFAGMLSDATPFELPAFDENETVVEATTLGPLESAMTRGEERAAAVQLTSTEPPAVAEDAAEIVSEGAAHAPDHVQMPKPKKQRIPLDVEPAHDESATVHDPAVHGAVQRQPLVVTLASATQSTSASARRHICVERRDVEGVLAMVDGGANCFWGGKFIIEKRRGICWEARPRRRPSVGGVSVLVDGPFGAPMDGPEGVSEKTKAPETHAVDEDAATHGQRREGEDGATTAGADDVEGRVALLLAEMGRVKCWVRAQGHEVHEEDARR
jgi:hypothetical protein